MRKGIYLIHDLLPDAANTERGGTEGLRVMVQKFEKHHPGTVSNLFELARRRIVRVGFCKPAGQFLLFFAAVLLLCCIGFVVSALMCIMTLVATLVVGLLGAGLLGQDEQKPLKFETFQNTMDFLYWFSILENELDHLEGNFAVLKQRAESKARVLAGFVLRDEKRVQEDHDAHFAEDLVKSRQKFKSFHSACWKTGLLESEYGKYFEGVEIPESNADSRVTVVG